MSIPSNKELSEQLASWVCEETRVPRNLLNSAALALRQSQRELEVLRAERDQGRERLDRAIKLMAGIYALLYPTPKVLADGRVVVLWPKSPKSPDPHEVLQELSDRIRALADEQPPEGT